MQELTPEQQVERILRERANLESLREVQLGWSREFTQELSTVVAEVAGRYPTAQEQTRIRDLKLSIAQIGRGLFSIEQMMLGQGALIEGVDPRLTPLVGKPGLQEVERRLARLRVELEKWQAKVGLDMDEQVTCRLTRMAAHVGPDGRLLKIGEEVLLTRRQLERFEDRFELVSGG